ncbi:MAG TPA: tRNA-uridine aminocarboxypropyltransferase [Polyangiaceae bacterium]|nr:tRNA-uridine aminocarboxypropyltransferase [Polyangiaceae bacterium]
MRSFTAPGAPGRCKRCYLLADYCICQLVGSGHTSQPQILIVRHHWEAFKSTGTARLAQLALENARIIDMAAENPEPVRAQLAALENAWLLYPGGASSPASAARPQTLVVLDGTWRQTQKMLRRLPEAARLPRFSLPEAPSSTERQRLREPPRPGARSTLESIADALGLLDSAECGQRLLELHEAFVTRTRKARGAPLVRQPTQAS